MGAAGAGIPAAGRGWSLPDRLDAVLLAAAPNTGPLRQASPEPFEALIPVGSRPMAAHVALALAGARRLGRIACVGPEAVATAASSALSLAGQGGRLVAVSPAGEGLLASLEAGLAAARTSYVLVATADIPLLRAHMVDDFVARCEQAEEPQDIWYSVVERSAGEARYPGVRRTWVRLADGTFTGGNLAVVERGIVARTRRLLGRAVDARKNPLGLARLLGWGTLWRFLRGRLTVGEAQARIGRILHVRGRAVVTPYVELGIDVDKPADLELARRHLEARAGAG